MPINFVGSSAWGYQLAEQFGLNVKPLRAGLVPLTLHQDDKAQQIKIIYLSMLCRQPTDKEVQLFQKESLQDIIWVILNTKEFIFTS